MSIFSACAEQYLSMCVSKHFSMALTNVSLSANNQMFFESLGTFMDVNMCMRAFKVAQPEQKAPPSLFKALPLHSPI